MKSRVRFFPQVIKFKSIINFASDYFVGVSHKHSNLQFVSIYFLPIWMLIYSLSFCSGLKNLRNTIYVEIIYTGVPKMENDNLRTLIKLTLTEKKFITLLLENICKYNSQILIKIPIHFLVIYDRNITYFIHLHTWALLKFLYPL